MYRSTIRSFTGLCGAMAMLGLFSGTVSAAPAPVPPPAPPPAPAPTASTPAPARIAVTGGTIEGHVTDGVLAFKGVPFAAPPIGALRWRAPQSVKAWPKVLDARALAPDCMQKVDFSGSNVGIPLLRTQPSEDCLYLNVLRPAESSARALPVMVWFHGGGFSTGGASPILFQGDSFAKRGVIFVSFNYRLGRLGFFAHPALSRENPEEPKANYGFLDQIAALKWVKRNIAAFGGDPNNVTIFGESAGGVSVAAMMVSPLARGLFQKAILESGPTHGLNKRELSTDQPGRLSLEKFGLAFAASKGIEGGDKAALAGLRALPAADLIDLSAGLPPGVDQARTGWGGPTMDGKVLPVVRGDYFFLGRVNKVPLIVGANSDDFTASTGALEPRPLDYTLARFGGLKDRALKTYDPEGTGDPRLIRRRVSADDHMIEPARFVARAVAGAGAPVYRYYFDYVSDALRERWYNGAPHGAEVAYAFDVLRYNYGPGWTDRDAGVARAVNGYWVNFAKNGNPNGADLPEWPRYDPATDIVMEFHRDGTPAAGMDPLKARLDLAQQVSARQRDPVAMARDQGLPQWPQYAPVP